MLQESQPTPTPRCVDSVDVAVVVLDTNVVLDWLLFDDPTCHELVARIHARRFIWHATQAMRAELLSVLPRPEFLPWSPNCERILAAFDQWSILWPAEKPAAESAVPRCRDPADQKFINLAYACSARWLFSRDRALLDLAKPARVRGLEILTPMHWLRHQAAVEPGQVAERRT